MEYLIAAQDVLVAAAADLEGIGSALAAANRAAEAPTTGLLPRVPTRYQRPSRRCFPGTPRPIKR